MFRTVTLSPLDIDWLTLGIFLLLTAIYGGLTALAALRLGSNFDERYKIVSTLGAAYLIIVGAWRFLDQRAREVARDMLIQSQTFCVESIKPASELSADYQAALHKEPLAARDVEATSAAFMKQYAQSPIIGDEQVASAMSYYYDVAERDNWGRNLTAVTPEDPNAISLRAHCLEQASEKIASACHDMAAASGIITLFDKHRASEASPDPRTDECLN